MEMEWQLCSYSVCSPLSKLLVSLNNCIDGVVQRPRGFHAFMHKLSHVLTMLTTTTDASFCQVKRDAIRSSEYPLTSRDDGSLHKTDLTFTPKEAEFSSRSCRVLPTVPMWMTPLYTAHTSKSPLHVRPFLYFHQFQNQYNVALMFWEDFMVKTP